MTASDRLIDVMFPYYNMDLNAKVISHLL